MTHRMKKPHPPQTMITHGNRPLNSIYFGQLQIKYLLKKCKYEIKNIITHLAIHNSKLDKLMSA